MSDQASINLSDSQPVDLTTTTTLERSGNPFPTIVDFEEGGRFEHLNVPFLPPLPISLLQYLYGDDIIHPDQVPNRIQYSIVKELHENVLKTGLYCDCGMHLLTKGSKIA